MTSVLDHLRRADDIGESEALAIGQAVTAIVLVE